VKTAEDFGLQGENPSHPELLDWLATEFIRAGWDVKNMQKLIVTSATYRQSSKFTPQLLSKDPENRLMARGPRFRLDAEAVRDTALEISGLLVENHGGRSVKPYQPSGLWEAVSFNNSQKYVPDKGVAEYRRTMYTYWKRQSPPPNLMLFDAPTRESCTVRRLRTNTPLQALALMNDPQIVEASRAFGQRMITEGGADARSRIAYGFRLATSRKPVAEEIKVLLNVFNQELADYQKDKTAAEKLLGVGDFKAKSDLDKAELAAWDHRGEHDFKPRRNDHQELRNLMDPLRERSLLMTRRHFFGRSAAGVGTLALGSLLNPSLFSAMGAEPEGALALGKPHFAPKAKRVIYCSWPADRPRWTCSTTSRPWKTSMAKNCQPQYGWAKGSRA